MEIKYLPISWTKYHNYAQQMAVAIISDTRTFDEIVAISRGGLTLGHLLSDLLKLPICTFAIQSYKDIKKQGEVKITQPLTKPIRGKNILLVDDVADSGKTLKRAFTYLNKLHPKSITLASMFYKPHSKVKPDIYAQKTTKWILFPYEQTEMILVITKSMKKQGKTKLQIQNMLTNLGYTLSQILFVRKYYIKN